MTTPVLIVANEHASQLGECPRWDERQQRLYWVDILAPAIQCLDPASGVYTKLPVDEHIGCLALAEEGGFVAGMRSGIWLLDAQGVKVRLLAANPEDQTNSRFNDGRCDPNGRFWAGTIDEQKRGACAHLYRLCGAGLTPAASGLLTSNGLAFSPDGRWMYHSDTPNFVIYRYAYDVRTGEASGRQEWVRFPSSATERGRPDGAAVDSEGFYWSALYEGGRVVRIAPDGTIVASYPLDARCPTMCAFGGPDLRTLYVTTARAGRPDAELALYPASGRLFSMRVATPGLAEPRFSPLSLIRSSNTP